MWVAFLAMLAGSAVVTFVGWQALREKLPRQSWAGIRTAYSLASDEQWYAVHRYGAPYMVFGGVASFSAALAMLPFSLAGKLPNGFSVAVILAIALVLTASALLSWFMGVRGAKAALGQ
ncbi:MAG TPA: SdpI family protein [Tepidiformaceae bacterium]|nr:SdpI family protein [Tepidiformaceae bacterium]HNO65414.1 SdpI family protein [Tepidiformaceae bacterium]